MKNYLLPNFFMTSIISIVCLFCFGFVSPCFSMDKASPQEVVEILKKAADLVAKDKDAGLAVINDKNGGFVLKNTYVFAYDCSNGTVVAHPIRPHLIGKKFMALKDIKGNYFFVQMCEAAQRGKNEWVEYWWPKPDEKKPSRKISLLINVPGITGVQLAAGIYDDNISVQELNEISK